MNNKQTSKMVIGSNGQLGMAIEYQFVRQIIHKSQAIKAQPNEIFLKINCDDLVFYILMKYDETENQAMVMPVLDDYKYEVEFDEFNEFVKQLLFDYNVYGLMFGKLMKKMNIEIEDGTEIDMFEMKSK